MKRLIICLFVALCCCGMASAIPAYRGRIVYTQPDGSKIVLRRNGDEFAHWLTNEDGQVVEMGEDGFYHVVSSSRIQARLASGRIRREAVNQGRRSVAKRGIASGTKHFLVILVQFQDVSFNFSSDAAARTAFENLLNQNGYNVNGGHGSARDFYYQNSNGYFEPIFDVYGPVTLANNKAYYGGNDSDGDDLRPREAVKEACQALDAEIDFAQYDNDGTGDVDLVFMYYAGYGEADSDDNDSIWPHQWSLSGIGTVTLDGKVVNSYACTNERIGYGSLQGQLCGIGTACHEFGHAMGLPDFYDTDYKTNGESGGLYEYSTMCSGSYNDNGRRPPYFNMEERIMLGWLQPSAIVEIPRSGTYTLTSVNNNVAYKSPTDKEGEYFLYECRSAEGWDTDLPEHGLIVYHVDKSDRMVAIRGGSTSVSAQSLWASWGTYNSINENGSHPCFYIVPAGGLTNLNYSGNKFAFPGAAKRYSFTGTSWNGVESEVKLSNISYSGGTVSFYAEAPSMELNYNVIANPNGGVYTAGSSFALTLSESEAQPVSSVQWYMDDEPLAGSSVTLPAGTHVIEAHITLTTGETKIVELTVVAQ